MLQYLGDNAMVNGLYLQNILSFFECWAEEKPDKILFVYFLKICFYNQQGKNI